MELDLYDKRILEILLNNSREQISSIGKKIRLRRENVNYRINRLIRSGLIKEFNTIINEKNLNLSHYVVFLELINLKDDTEEKILNYLKNSKYMGWIGTSAGKWSLTFDVIAPERTEIEKIVKDFLDKFSRFIDDYVLLRFQEGDYFGLKFLGLVKEANVNKSIHNEVKLDKKDIKILSLLNKNSRANYVEISKIVNLTPNGITNRIKNLKKSGIISSYTISLDWKKLGYEWYGVQLKLTKFGEEVDRRLINYFKNHERIIFYYKYLGGIWDYDIGVIVKDSNELRDFINEFRKNFSDSVKISDVFLTLEETTGYKLPNGIFE
ncbi:Lrp/AsnC family transcriptional regulator [Candidatus Woesearchaeota archaeon]|nr:Lrp/AsnC family transcriptional regulator [Candidatus Woesearchaeota archaeon]